MLAFVGKQDYDQLHTDDGILDIEGWHPMKQIVTKHLRQNIIMTLQRIDISKAKERHNWDYNDDTNFSDDGGEVPNDSNYHEPQPQNNDPTIGHLLTFRINRVSKSYII